MESSKGSEKFCLRWNEYETNISNTFRELRTDQDFTDVTLAAEDNFQIEVHKIILAASSPFFSALLRKCKNEDKHHLIYLRGVKGTDLKAAVDFMYNGEVNVFQEDLKEFLSVAEELQLRGLRQDEGDEKVGTVTEEAGEEGNTDEIIIDPSENINDSDAESIGIEEVEVEPLITNGSKLVVEETDDMEEMIEGMMMRVNGDWTCGICGKRAGKYKNNLRKHVEIVHVDQKGKPCKFCGKTFKSRPNLYAHLRRCQQGSPQQSKVAKPTYLSFIQQEDKTKDDQSNHQEIALLDAPETFDLDAKVESLMTFIDGNWLCGVCGKDAGNLKANLRKHVEARHMDGMVVPCSGCGQTFGSRSALQNHMCHQEIPNNYSPVPFMVTPEFSGTGFLCELCNKEFKTNQSLKVHIQAIHEGIKYNCEFCPHSATTKSNLKVHVQKKHSLPQVYL